MRLRSQKARQAIFVVGEALESFALAEYFELYDEQGRPIDVSTGASKMRWMGEWASGAIYQPHDVVSYEDALWITETGAPPGITPGDLSLNPVIAQVHEMDYYASDRINSIMPRTLIIGPPPGKRIENDILADGKYGQIFCLDRTGALDPGTVVVVKPLSRVSGGMVVLAYKTDGSSDATLTFNWTEAEADEKIPKMVNVAAIDSDRYFLAYFDDGVDGTFEVSVSTSTNLAIPASAAEWIELSAGGGGGGGGAANSMLWRGAWDPAKSYQEFEVVQQDVGAGMATYIFNEAVPSGAPEMYDHSVPPNRIYKFWDPAKSELELVIDADSAYGAGPHAAGKYDMFAIKINGPGNLYLSSRPKDYVSRDMYAAFYKQQPGGSWAILASDDDNSGLGHPRIFLAVDAGIYLYTFGPYAGGPDQSSAYETAVVSRKDPDTTAVIGSFAEFPITKVTKIS